MGTDAGAIEVDVLARSESGQTVLVAEIKRRKAVDDVRVREQVARYVERLRASFAMLVDDERILVAQASQAGIAWERGVTISTAAVVSHYSPGKDPGAIEGFFLESLIEAWLRDLAVGWHCTSPPGLAELTRLGVGGSLRGSEILTEQVA